MKEISHRCHTQKSGGLCSLISLLSAAFTLYAGSAQAESIIKQPGNHPVYSVDLEPHLALGLDDTYYAGTGYGLGARVTIPFLRNGPISTINNDMGIGFGLDWLTRGNSCNYGYYYGRGPNYYNYSNCGAYSLYVPVVLQWNFYLTDIITVYGEPGFALRYSHVSWDFTPLGCAPGNYACQGSNSYTDPILVIAGGAQIHVWKNCRPECSGWISLLLRRSLNFALRGIAHRNHNPGQGRSSLLQFSHRVKTE